MVSDNKGSKAGHAGLVLASWQPSPYHQCNWHSPSGIWEGAAHGSVLALEHGETLAHCINMDMLQGDNVTHQYDCNMGAYFSCMGKGGGGERTHPIILEVAAFQTQPFRSWAGGLLHGEVHLLIHLTPGILGRETSQRYSR